MKERQSNPSIGFWLVLASWSVAAAFVIWGTQTPELDELASELQTLELTDQPTAPPDLVRHLEHYTTTHPILATSLAGDSGARILEAQRDGWANGKSFHLIVREAPPARLKLESSTKARIRLSFNGENVEVQCEPNQKAIFTFPTAWRASARIVQGERLDGPGPIRVAGVTDPGAP